MFEVDVIVVENTNPIVSFKDLEKAFSLLEGNFRYRENIMEIYLKDHTTIEKVERILANSIVKIARIYEMKWFFKKGIGKNGGTGFIKIVVS